jgi:RimJ/RimL family protein N-acetyltransferase
MDLEPVTLAQSDLVLSIFEGAPNYFLKIDGTVPTLKTVTDAITNTPKQMIPEYVKEFLILRETGRPIGTCELHLHHPEVDIAYIGLLLIREDCFGRGLGKKAFAAVERYIREKHGCKRIRLGVSDENDVSGFWSKLGFQADGKTYTWMGERRASHVVEYEKSLPEASVPL